MLTLWIAGGAGSDSGIGAGAGAAAGAGILVDAVVDSAFAGLLEGAGGGGEAAAATAGDFDWDAAAGGGVDASAGFGAYLEAYIMDYFMGYNNCLLFFASSTRSGRSIPMTSRFESCNLATLGCTFNF